MNNFRNYLKTWLLLPLAILALAGCDDRQGITSPPITTVPTVSSTNPLNAATDIPFNRQITATFSEEMDSSTITTATFTLMQGTSFVSGTVTYTGTIAAFVPSGNLAPNTLYTATITTMAKSLMGRGLAVNYVWSFTTGIAPAITPPSVSLTDPINAATGIPINQKIAVTYSVAMDAATITSSTFTLRQGTIPVPGFVSYSGITGIFAPTSNLSPNTAYSVTITTGSKDLAGNALVNNYVWSFTTGSSAIVTAPIVSSTDPINAASGIPINQKIAATFSNTMDATTITTSTFNLAQGTTSVSGFVSYSGATAIFAPASNLAPNTEYTVTITTGAKNLAGNAIANNYIWNFTTGAAAIVTSPTVSSTDPVNAATGVPFNQKISATFSKTMDASTITTTTYTLMQGTTFVSGTVGYVGTTATYTPSSNLLPNTTYTSTITTGAKDLAGNAIVNNYVWSFTTGASVVVIPPIVSFTDPANAAVGVGLNQKVAATFSKTMDASTINSATFTLKQGTNSVSGFVLYSGSTAIFTTASNLLPNTLYTATITTGAKDLAGNALENKYVWNFTTGAAVVVTSPLVISTDPVNLATGVALNQKVVSTFSKTMDASTITSATFTLLQGTSSVPGLVSYSGTNATFTPTNNLVANTLYTATITSETKDLAGNALEDDYIWSFTTGAATVVTPPTVISTDPVDEAICIELNKQIETTFSKAMDASTITTATFTLLEVQAASSVSGTVSYVGTTATFTTLIDLKPNTTYRATITTGAKDLSGNSLTENYMWTFTTVVPYTVTLSSNPLLGGTASGGGTFNSCSSVTVTATTNIDYTFTNWTENGIEVSADEIYTFTLDENRTLIANFTDVTTQYSVSLSSNPSEGGTTSGEGLFDSGTSVTVTSNPNLGYTFIDWTENGITVSSNANYQFNIIENRILVANFAVVSEEYAVTLSSNPLLGGNTNGSGLYNSGASVTVTALPNAGYIFTNWSEDGLQVSENANYTFTIIQNTTLVANFTLTAPTGQLPVVLGTAARFAVLSNSNLTNIPASSITGDVGISPGLRSNITGFVLTPDITNEFSTDPQVNGGGPGIYAANDAGPTPAMLIAAKADAEAAYLDATAALRGTPTPLSGNINGLTLVPGLYQSGSSIEISPGGSVTLDAGGDNTAVFIIRSATSITTEATSEVILAGNANPANIYWVAGTTATLGVNTVMKGTIIASSSISLLTGANLVGRVLIQSAAAGQVSLDQNTIVLP